MEFFIGVAIGYVVCLMQSYILGWLKVGWAKLTGKLQPPPVS